MLEKTIAPCAERFRNSLRGRGARVLTAHEDAA